MEGEEKMDRDIVKADENKDVSENITDEKYVIWLHEPVTFEGKKYDKIDLTCLEQVRVADMIAVNRKLANEGNSDVVQENSLEYAINLAARASDLPIEFFEQLKPGPGMRVKRCVMSFLYRQG